MVYPQAIYSSRGGRFVVQMGKCSLDKRRGFNVGDHLDLLGISLTAA